MFRHQVGGNLKFRRSQKTCSIFLIHPQHPLHENVEYNMRKFDGACTAFHTDPVIISSCRWRHYRLIYIGETWWLLYVQVANL